MRIDRLRASDVFVSVRVVAGKVLAIRFNLAKGARIFVFLPDIALVVSV